MIYKVALHHFVNCNQSLLVLRCIYRNNEKGTKKKIEMISTDWLFSAEVWMHLNRLSDTLCHNGYFAALSYSVSSPRFYIKIYSFYSSVTPHCIYFFIAYISYLKQNLCYWCASSRSGLNKPIPANFLKSSYGGKIQSLEMFFLDCPTLLITETSIATKHNR